MSDDRKNAVSLKVSDRTIANLDRVRALVHTDKTGALEYAIAFAARPAGERAEAVLGHLAAPRVEQALECWTNVLAGATEDNSKAFRQQEWCLIADVCNGTLWEPSVTNPAVMLAANVEDGHRLDGTGYKWLGKEGDEIAGSLARVGIGTATPQMAVIDRQVAGLVQRIAALDGIHGWAMVAAVQWFWDHCGDDIAAAEPWWTLAFRRAWAKKRKG